MSDYVAQLSGWQAEAVTQLRDILREALPEAEEAIKWSQPVWSAYGPLCFIKAFKAHINFGFWRGVELDDPQQLLEGSGVKMRHVKIRSLEDIHAEAFGAFLRQALELSRLHGDPSR